MSEDFSDKLDELDIAMESSAVVAERFQAELRRMQASIARSSEEVQSMTSVINRGFRSAVDDMVFDGGRLSDALRTIGKSMLDAAYSAALKPVTSHVSGLVASGMEQLIAGSMKFADGGSFSQGRVQPFARGGVVDGPTYFPMRRGVGLMGEAGPEAIVPLSRDSSGRLGIQSQGNGQPIQITMNISTPDVASFSRSRTQIAASLARAVERGQGLR